MDMEDNMDNRIPSIFCHHCGQMIAGATPDRCPICYRPTLPTPAERAGKLTTDIMTAMASEDAQLAAEINDLVEGYIEGVPSSPAKCSKCGRNAADSGGVILTGTGQVICAFCTFAKPDETENFDAQE